MIVARACKFQHVLALSGHGEIVLVGDIGCIISIISIIFQCNGVVCSLDQRLTLAVLHDEATGYGNRISCKETFASYTADRTV